MKARMIKIDQVKRVIGRNPQHQGSLIAVLQDLQKEFNYLPQMALKEASTYLGVPLSKVYSAATFYKAFSLKPKGDTIIRICKGTACHIKGADLLLEQLDMELGIKPGETTEDLKYTIEVVNCVGACAMAPVMIVNDKYHGNVRVDKALKLVKKG